MVATYEGRQVRYALADAHLACALSELVQVVLAVDADEPCVDDEHGATPVTVNSPDATGHDGGGALMSRTAVAWRVRSVDRWAGLGKTNMVPADVTGPAAALADKLDRGAPRS